MGNIGDYEKLCSVNRSMFIVLLPRETAQRSPVHSVYGGSLLLSIAMTPCFMQLKPGKHDKGCVVSNNALSRSPFAKGEEFFVEDSEPPKPR